MPILEFPFAPSGRSGNSSGGSGFSLFAFGRSPQKNQQGQRERPVRCEVDPDSVRSSRGGAYSFTVHVQGDNGTELSASYVSPQHKVRVWFTTFATLLGRLMLSCQLWF